MSREVKVGNEWVRVAGRGKAEYGASHYQTGTVGNPEITNGKSSGFYKSLQVTFDETMPDTDYQVTLAMVGSYWAEVDVAVGTRTTTGFTILFKYTHVTAEPATLTIAENSFQVKWQAFKLYSDKEYDELLDDVATLNAYPKIYSVYGQILTSDSAMRGNGTATVTLFANKTCRIEFSAKITTAGTNASQFNCGLSRNLLKSLNSNIPTITPVKGGVLEWYGTDGIRDKDHLGYAGMLEASSGQPYWKFARVYQTSGTTDAYPETECTVGKCYIGTAYGTWA